MYFCVADKAFESSTTTSALALHAYLSRHSLLPSILLYESHGVLSSGMGAFGMIRKPESYHIVSRYQVATPSRAITARATGPEVITDTLMRTTSRTPERFSGVDHRKRLRRPDSNWRHSAYETDGIDLTSPLRDLSSGGWGRTNDLVINSHPLFH